MSSVRDKLGMALIVGVMLFGLAAIAQETIIDTEPGACTTPVTFQTLSDDQAKIETDKRRYLESNGWAYNCDNPGSLWLWAKVIDGKEYRLELETAVAIQVHSDTAG